MKTLKLRRVGRNYWGNIAYKDEDGKFYLDIDMVCGKEPQRLYYCHPSNDMDGEPGIPVKEEFEIVNAFTDQELRMQSFRLEYARLSRLNLSV